jgi:hypothetical protein
MPKEGYSSIKVLVTIDNDVHLATEVVAKDVDASKIAGKISTALGYAVDTHGSDY